MSTTATILAVLLASGGISVEAPWGICADAGRYVYCDGPEGVTQPSRAASVPEWKSGGVTWTTATIGPGTVTVRAVEPPEWKGRDLAFRSDAGATVRRESGMLVLVLPHFERPERPFDTTEIRAWHPWDLDRSGTVDGADLGIVIGSWSNPYGGADLSAILGAWGAGIGGTGWNEVQ